MRHLMHILTVFVVLGLSSCAPAAGPGPGPSDPVDPDPDPDPVVPTDWPIARNFWGEWREIETGDSYYFASDMVFYWRKDVVLPGATYEARQANTEVVKFAPTNAAGATFPAFDGLLLEAVSQEPDLLRRMDLDRPRLLARVSSSSIIQGTAVQTTAAVGSAASGTAKSSRALNLHGVGGIKMTVQNLLNKADTVETVSVTEGVTEGVFETPEVLAGDTYTVQAGTGDPILVEVLPGITEAGIAPDISVDASLPKLVLIADSVESWDGNEPKFIYGGQAAYLSYYIQNPGEAEVPSLSWTIREPSSGATIQAGATGTLIQPLSSGAVTSPSSLSFTPAALAEEADSAYLVFRVDFTMGAESWTDSVRVRVFRESVDFDFIGSSASVFIKTPIGTFMNHWGTSSAPLKLPYLRGEWFIELNGSGGYAWSCGGPLVSSLAVNDLTAKGASADLNEPNDGPATATAAGYRSSIWGALGSGDYDFFMLILPAPPVAGIVTAPEALAFPVSGPKVYDLDFELDDSGAPVAAAIWNGSSGQKLGIWRRDGASWSSASTAVLNSTRIALQAQNGRAAVLTDQPSLKAVSWDGIGWTTLPYDLASPNIYDTAGGDFARLPNGRPIGASFGGTLATAAGFVSSYLPERSGFYLVLYDPVANSWTQEQVLRNSPIQIEAAVSLAPSPEFLYYVYGAPTNFRIARKTGTGWETADIDFDSAYDGGTAPHFFGYGRDGKVRGAWEGLASYNTNRPPVIARRDGTASWTRWYLPNLYLQESPKSGFVQAGGDGQDWVLVNEEKVTKDNFNNPTTSFRLWLLKLGANGVYGAELMHEHKRIGLSTDPAPFRPYGDIGFGKAVQDAAGTLHILWEKRTPLNPPSATEYTSELFYTEREGY